MEVKAIGYDDIYLEKYDETISCNRPTVLVRNLVIGTMFVDFDGDSEVINHKTGEKIKM